MNQKEYYIENGTGHNDDVGNEKLITSQKESDIVSTARGNVDKYAENKTKGKKAKTCCVEN